MQPKISMCPLACTGRWHMQHVRPYVVPISTEIFDGCAKFCPPPVGPCRFAQHRFLLEVAASNAAALALYHKAGFTVDGVRKGYYGPGNDAVLMSWHSGS